MPSVLRLWPALSVAVVAPGAWPANRRLVILEQWSGQVVLAGIAEGSRPPAFSPSAAIAGRLCIVKDFLVTIRYAELRSFDVVAAKFSSEDGRHTSVEIFVALIDEMTVGPHTHARAAAILGNTSAIVLKHYPPWMKSRQDALEPTVTQVWE